MTIEHRSIKDVHPNPQNPRDITEANFEKLKRSISNFPEMLETRPLIVNPDGIVLGGNMRLRALSELEYKTVPVIEVDWDEARQMEFVIKDNLESGHWDWDVLGNIYDGGDLIEWGLDAWDPTSEEDIEEADEEKYTRKVDTPVYEPKGEQPPVEDLVDLTKHSDLFARIEAADVPDDVKQFLRHAADRHKVFHYDRIADYYAHAAQEIQSLFEDSALVIVDFEKAIEEGYVQLAESVREQFSLDAQNSVSDDE